MRRLARAFTVAPMLLLAAVVEAGAAPITFGFTGAVTQVPLLDPGDPFGGTIGFGTAVTGSFTFDSDAPALTSAPRTASYQMSGSPFGLTVSIGGHLFSTSDFLAINVANNLASTIDQYGVLACSGSVRCSGDLIVELFFQDNQGTAFTSVALPLSAPDLGSFQIRDFHLGALVAGNQVQIDGEIRSLTGGVAVPAPAPATLLLLGLAMLPLISRRRRRR